MLWKSDHGNSGTFMPIDSQVAECDQSVQVDMPRPAGDSAYEREAGSTVIVNHFASGPAVGAPRNSRTTPNHVEAAQSAVKVRARNPELSNQYANQPLTTSKSTNLPPITFENDSSGSAKLDQHREGDQRAVNVAKRHLQQSEPQGDFVPKEKFVSTSVPAPQELPRGEEDSLAQPPDTNVIPISGSMLLTKLERGESLARRGAWATAQKEFVDVLYLMAQQADLRNGGNVLSRRLRDALLALDEAQDFMADSGPSSLDVSALISRHQSKILKTADSTDLTNFAAAQAYYSAARVMFHDTFQKNKLASRAFYSLGKLHSISSVNGNDEATQSARAMLFQYAALDCDDRNYPAANELGVMLAKSNRLEEARDVLNHCANVQPTLSTLQSLAHVNEALGETAAARQAEMFASNLEAANKRPNPNEFIPFIDHESFNAIPDYGAENYTAMNSASRNSAPPSTAEKATETKESRWKLWR